MLSGVFVSFRPQAFLRERRPRAFATRDKGDRMLLEGEATGDDGALLRHRITWSPLPGCHVRQFWDSTKDCGKTWEVVFDGDYAPKTR